MTTLVRAQRIMTADRDLRDGWLLLADDADATVVDRGTGVAPTATATVTVAHTLLPAFVDLHAHGALGADFATADVTRARAAAGHHASRGTGALIGSVATGTATDTVAAIGRVRHLVEDGTLAGIHLEGPYLSHTRRGAHDPSLLRPPDLAELGRLLDVGGGTVRIVTLAPELDGAVAAVRWLVRHGVVVAVGHTDADAETVRRAVDAGASLVTHLGNGMPPMASRRPGPVGAALTDDRVLLEVVLDGHHLDDVVVEVFRRAAGDRLVMVSDAMSATGCGDGTYVVAGSEVRVADGTARLADGSSLAGSTATLGDAVSRWISTRRFTGVTLADVVAASSSRAAAVLGLPAPLSVGAPGTTVLLDATTGTVRPWSAREAQ